MTILVILEVGLLRNLDGDLRAGVVALAGNCPLLLRSQRRGTRFAFRWAVCRGRGATILSDGAVSVGTEAGKTVLHSSGVAV